MEFTEEFKLDGIRRRIDTLVIAASQYDSLKDIMPQIEQTALVGKSIGRSDFAMQYLREIISMMFPRKLETMSTEQISAMHKRFPRCIATNAIKQIKGRVGKWNKFSECIPNEDGYIIVSDGFCLISALWCWDGLHTKELDVEDIAELTHWMSYPKRPKIK